MVLDEGDAAGVEKFEDEENDVEWDGDKLDRRTIDYVVEDLEKDGEGNDGQENFLWNQRVTVVRLWRTQVDAYEGRILDLEKKLGSVSDGFKAAKRVAEEETAEVERLRKVYMEKISEAERLKETVADLVERNWELEMADQTRKRNSKRRVQELRKNLDMERRHNATLEKQLSNTRKKLLTFTRRSVPCRGRRRLIRRIDSYEDGTESSV